MKKLLLASTLLLGMGAFAPSQAATFTSDHCSGGCGPQPTGFATITGTQVNANTVGITLNLLNNNGIVDTGLHAFTFNLIGNQTVTYVGLSTLFDPIGTTTLTQAPGSIMQDGFGTFQYGLDYLGGSGGSNPFKGTLSFLLTSATPLSLSDFAKLSSGGDPSAYMTIDILSGTTGKTGAVDCCAVGTPFDITPVPLPPALPLFIAGMIGLGWLGKKRKGLNVKSAA